MKDQGPGNGGRSRHILYVYSGKAKPKGIGLDLVVRQQVLALAEAGHRVTLLCRGRIRHPRVTNVAFPVTPANLISFLAAKHYYNAQNRFFSQVGAWILKSGSFDAVISWTRQSRNLFRAANARGVPCFLNCPGWHYNFPLGNNRWVKRSWPSFQMQDMDEEYNRADVLLTASEHASSTYLANGLAPAKITSIGRAADPQRFHYQERPASPFRAVFFGQVSERKGIFQVLEAWRQAAIADGELWIIGNVPKELEREVKEKLPGNARLFGHRNDGETLLSQCHVQLLLSRQEGMAKSLVEGAACGLVTLTTRESGFPIEEGDTGYYVEREDVAGVAARLRQLAAAPEEWQRMSARSAQFVRSHLTWPMFQARFVAAVEQHLARLA